MSSGGLRERKKQRTRESIQDHALRLYQEQGYAATTIDQIAEAAEVSPSTYFRYFPTKPDTVLFDRMDPIFIDEFLAQPQGQEPLAALRAAMRTVFSAMSEEHLANEMTRMRLVVEVPELRAASAQQIETNLPLFTDAVARRVGREPDDVVVLHWVGAVVGAVMVAFYRAVGNQEDVFEAVDRALDYMESGMPL